MVYVSLLCFCIVVYMQLKKVLWARHPRSLQLLHRSEQKLEGWGVPADLTAAQNSYSLSDSSNSVDFRAHGFNFSLLSLF